MPTGRNESFYKLIPIQYSLDRAIPYSWVGDSFDHPSTPVCHVRHTDPCMGPHDDVPVQNTSSNKREAQGQAQDDYGGQSYDDYNI